MSLEAASRGMLPQAWETKTCQQNNSPLGLPEEKPCRHLDLGLPASRIV